MRKLILLFIPLIILGCSNNTKNSSTVIFEKYLEDTFNSHISFTDHYYIIVPQFSCQGCIYNTLNGNLSILENKSEIVTFIISNKDENIREYLPKYLKVKFDNDNKLDYLSFNFANITIIETRQGSVFKIVQINDSAEFISFFESDKPST